MTHRPFTKDELDIIYESYVIAKLRKNSQDEKLATSHYEGQELAASNNKGTIKAEERQILSLIGDPASLYQMAQTIGTSVSGIMAFLAANSDVLTALGIVSQLEARAQYDPRFRNSIPSVVRNNAPEWIL